jgi:hypothetical protein
MALTSASFKQSHRALSTEYPQIIGITDLIYGPTEISRRSRKNDYVGETGDL